VWPNHRSELTALRRIAKSVAAEVDGMAERTARTGRRAAEPDVTAYCPNCGTRGEWQKCKLLCPNPQCSVRIILACVD
jgi:hypothetical protein